MDLRQALFLLGFGLLPVALVSPPSPAEPHAGKSPQYKSPLGLAVDPRGERAYVALHTAGAVAAVDLKTGRVLREQPVGPQPSDVALIDGSLYVVCGERDQLAVLDQKELTIRRHIPLSQAPREVVRRLEEGRVDSNQAAFLLADRDNSNLRGPAAFRDVLFFVHQRPRNEVPATQVAQGWVFTNALSFVVNVPARTALLDEPQRGYADPSAIAIAPDGGRLYITAAGADALLVVDRERLLRMPQAQGLRGGYGSNTGASDEDLTASRHYVIARLPTQANPRRLALSGDGKTLVISNHLADSLTVIDTVNLKVLRHIPLGGPAPDTARRGEVLFHSARLTFQGQFSCASCHPGGGSDELTWDLERDGVGNFKRTKSLLGVKDTTPYGWHGASPTLADRVAGTLRTLHRHEPAGTEVDDLVAYLESLPPPKPPQRPDSEQPAITRGRAVFQGKGLCANCHHRAGLDDGKSHDVGTRGPADTQDRLDTPALRGLSQAKSFLHDGRARTLEEVFTQHNSRQRHGAAHLLSKEELADLITYLKSL